MQTRHKEIYCDLLGCSPETNAAHYCIVPELDAKPFTPAPPLRRESAINPRTVDPSEPLYQRMGDDYVVSSIQPTDPERSVSMCETCWDFHGTTASCTLGCGCHFEKVTEQEYLLGAFVILACAGTTPEAADMFAELLRALELLPDGLRGKLLDNPTVAEMLSARAFGAEAEDNNGADIQTLFIDGCARAL